MYKVISSHFVANETGSTLVASFFTDSFQNGVSSTNKKCLVTTIINQKDSENTGKIIDQGYILEQLANNLKRAENLKLDIDIATDETNHEVVVNINGATTKFQPTEFSFY